MDNLENKDLDAAEEIEEVEDDDGGIEAPPPKVPKVPRAYKREVKPTDRRLKGNRERTPAQEAAWKKCLEARQQNRDNRKEVRNEIIEKKILKKAITAKKAQILREKVLDDALPSDEEIPDEIIQRVMKKTRPKSAHAVKVVEKIVYREPPQPAYVFV